jgi:hypothetical protein
MQHHRHGLSLWAFVLALAAFLLPERAEAACTWTIKGKLAVDHRLDQLEDEFGVSALANVQVKVSAKTKVLGVWGTWNDWPIDRTSADGSFSVSEEKTCEERRFKVEVKFQDDDLEVRHHTSTSSLTKVLWYTVHEETSGSRSAGTIDLGTKTFSSGGGHDLNDDEAWSHADIWVTYRLAIAKAASFGADFAFTTQIKVKYPHNSDVAPDNVEASYANPTTKVIYIFRSNDGSEDHLSVGTLLHEMGHIWAYNHTKGEICLTETLVTTGNTHGTVSDSCVAFHEGWAEFFADEMERALFGGTKVLPFGRPALIDRGMTSTSLVERTDDGWTSFFHLLTTPNLHQYHFGTESSSGPTGRIEKLSTIPTGCTSPNLGFKQMMMVFNAGDGLDQIVRADTTIATFVDRAIIRLSGLNQTQGDTMERLTNPQGTAQPSKAFCPGK